VVETAECLLDQRHLDAGKLAAMLDDAKRASERFAEEEDIEVEWERIWNIEPILFDDALLELADEAVKEVAGTSHRLPSGPLHDAAEVARAGIPTVMVFVQSLRGLSHTKLEDTKEEHLELAVQALDRLAAKTIDRVAAL
jgi:N-carbamoyl-L-amino-acid hydrolase